jgi:hypothetical protein
VLLALLVGIAVGVWLRGVASGEPSIQGRCEVTAGRDIVEQDVGDVARAQAAAARARAAARLNQ